LFITAINNPDWFITVGWFGDGCCGDKQPSPNHPTVINQSGLFKVVINNHHQTTLQ
jgi:hypothetical protein